LEGHLIRPDVLGHEGNAVLRKKLFLPVTGASPRLGIHHHALRHPVLPIRLLKKTHLRRPTWEWVPPRSRDAAAYV
jgi:hypothetical protein